MFQRDKGYEPILNEETLRRKRIPLLHKDENWIDLFGKSDDKEINEVKDRLIDLIKREGKLEKLLNRYKKDKTKYVKLILKASDSINTDKKKEDIRLLDEYKERLLSINEEMDELAFELETIPDEIRKTNYELLNMTIHKGYSELREKEEELEDAKEELLEVRERMKQLIEIKVKNEEWINEIYTFMHRLLGNDIIDFLDEKVFK